MPEARVAVRWPDGVEDVCWSPSLVVHDHLEAGAAYAVDDFVARTEAAMAEADRRVRARWGMGCTGAAETAALVRRRAAALSGAAAAGAVRVLAVEPPLPDGAAAPGGPGAQHAGDGGWS